MKGWSDRIGSDEHAELDFCIETLDKALCNEDMDKLNLKK